MDDGGIDVEALYRRFGPMVLRRCRRLLGNEDDALEVAQEVFVSLVRNRRRLDERYPSSLLFRMATNLSLNRIRDRRHQPLLPGDEVLHRIAGRTSTRRSCSTRSSAASPPPPARWRSSTSWTG
jgi:DNA-directed RNA polymerase specialized sigma24 family protein